MIESPCNKVCAMDGDGYCLGCRRTLEEIGGWASANDTEKRAILAAIQRRPLRPRG